MRYLREMPFKDSVVLLGKKVNEKWNAISLDVVKNELTPQHEVLVQMLKGLSEEK